MTFITKQDLSSHIFEESIDIITRGDDTKVDTAIQTAITQASGYLSRYDTDTIFASEGEEKLKYAILVTYIKDLAKWHLVAVCNAAVDLETTDSRYKSAIVELGKIQAGKVIPKGWPASVDTNNSKPFRSGSRTKFNHS